jgi:hypothetical protein
MVGYVIKNKCNRVYQTSPPLFACFDKCPHIRPVGPTIQNMNVINISVKQVKIFIFVLNKMY